MILITGDSMFSSLRISYHRFFSVYHLTCMQKAKNKFINKATQGNIQVDLALATIDHIRKYVKHMDVLATIDPDFKSERYKAIRRDILKTIDSVATSP